ncbi:MAG: PIG-L family deacetylase [Clostridia bacterium]|nr:PIG-L family deacetylase [Clostridia bacterium]
MKVLAISCHPDDMEICCGGTLLRCVKRGDDVTVCHVANGNMGHVVIEKEELGKMRIAEAKKAGDMAGFTTVTCDVGDLLVDSASKEQHDKLVKIIREVDPDFIITHGPDDYMGDHVEVSHLTFKAAFAATVPHYEPQLGKACRVVPIYYMDNSSLLNCEPTEYVDITNELNTKIKMLKCHESQLEWLSDHDGNDIVDATITFARMRGIQSGVKYAEGFRQCLTDHRIVTKRLLP